MGMMAEGKDMASNNNNYSFFQAKVTLPRVTSLPKLSSGMNNLSSRKDVTRCSSVDMLSFKEPFEKDHDYRNKRVNRKKKKNRINPLPCTDHDLSYNADHKLFIPGPHLLPQLATPEKSQVIFVKDVQNEKKNNRTQYDFSSPKKVNSVLKGNSAYMDSTENSVLEKPIKNNKEAHLLSASSSSNKNTNNIETDSNVSDGDLIDMYKNYLEKHSDTINDNDFDHSDSDVSVSSLSDTDDSCSVSVENTLVSGSFEPLYSLPLKDTDKKSPNRDISGSLNKVVLSNSKTLNDDSVIYQSGSLPELHRIDECKIHKVSHVMKNESEAESEPGAQRKFKIRPLPPIETGTSSNSNLNNSHLYETIDKFPKRDAASHTVLEKKTFKQIATLLTLVPRVPTNQARSRKSDNQLADILKYLPDKKLKIFIGTWNMKGTRHLPPSLDDFLLPPESVFLQDVYVIGTQEGTPFRHEWQLRLQETFGPSHVLVQASNFGVLNLSVFVRRELVWFCSNVEQDTIATRVGHKIKTKGALAMSFSIFGTSFLFINSHFTSNEGKLKERINDYNQICQNLQLPSREQMDDSMDPKDVTNRFDRVFWFGDFNFRVKRPRNVVDKLIHQHGENKRLIISELLTYDQLNDVRGKIFHGFTEAPIHFMPTYKFDVNTDEYDNSAKQRVPSWTDRVLSKSVVKEDVETLCYNSCDTIKNSDHRPVYAIFETIIEPYKSKFVNVGGAQFDRDIYVEANMRRNAPSGNQNESHVCIIL